MKKRKFMDEFTHDEMMLVRVIERAMRAAKTLEELEEARKCMARLCLKVVDRKRKELEKKDPIT